MTNIDIFIIAFTWLGVGIVMTALAFNVRVDKEKEKLFKDTKELLNRNKELIEQNKRLTSNNNEIHMRLKSIEEEIEYLTSLFRN